MAAYYATFLTCYLRPATCDLPACGTPYLPLFSPGQAGPTHPTKLPRSPGSAVPSTPGQSGTSPLSQARCYLHTRYDATLRRYVSATLVIITLHSSVAALGEPVQFFFFFFLTGTTAVPGPSRRPLPASLSYLLDPCPTKSKEKSLLTLWIE